MNNVINFLLILTLVFLVYTNSNIGVMLARSIPGKFTLVVLIIYLSASHGISSGILMSLITILLLNNYREGEENMEKEGTMVTGTDSNKGSFSGAAGIPDNEKINTPDESDKIPINLIIPSKMNKTDLEEHLRVAAEVAAMNAKIEEGSADTIVQSPSASVAGVSTSANVQAVAGPSVE